MKLGTRRPSRPVSPRKRETSASASTSDASMAAASDSAEALVIARLSHEGRGVARDATGKTVFVEGALPGERVRVRRHRQHKRYDEAHLESTENASPDRVTPACEHFTTCGGCSLQHLALPAQRHYKQQVLTEHLLREKVKHPAPGVMHAAGYGYRRRARLGVKVDRHGNLLFGFRRKGTERLFNIRQCPVLTAPLQALLEPLREVLKTLEAPQLVGHIELIEADPVLVSVRQIKPHARDEARWREFAMHQGVALYGNGEAQADAAPQQPYYALAVATEQETRHINIGFQPGDFIQVNGEVNQQLVNQVLDWLAPQPQQQVMDLFAGVGNFSLPLALRGASVTAVEGSSRMVARLLDNARRMKLELKAFAHDLGQSPSLAEAAAVVLDPPRDGAAGIAAALARQGPPRVVYISCNPATLARDAAQLTQAGYRLERLALVDMFPQTAHMESLSLFVRDTPASGVIQQ